jgi:predicted  nucleic acid-binding Zn-ribbon protein
MDQIHLPDPIKEDLQVLQRENSALVDHVLDLENEVRKLRRELDKGESKFSEQPLERDPYLITTGLGSLDSAML